MSHRKHFRPLAFVASAGLITGTGLGLSAPALAEGAKVTPPKSHHVSAAHPPSDSQHLSKTKIAQVRDRQRQMIANHKAAPSFAKAGSKTFNVNTTADTPLANPAGTTCVDASNKCSLRAAVEAADNGNKPVKIVLGKHTYTLSTGSQLAVTNPKGVSVVGQGAGKTIVEGDGSGVFYLGEDSGNNPGALFLSALKLRHGSSTNGGAVELQSHAGSTLVLDHVTASNNSAAYGGAIYSYGYNSIYLNASSLTNNTAEQGGAIYQYWSDIAIQDSEIDDNTATNGSYGYGGGVYNYYGVFDMTGGSISHNTAGDATGYGEGGGIYDEDALTTLNNVHLDHNTASSGSGSSGYGGAIYADEDAIEINHGTISHNRAEGSSYGSGGGIYGDYGNQIALNGVTMVGNKAGGSSDGYGGGAIFMYGEEYPSQLDIKGGRISGSNNSAIYLYGYYGGVDTSITNATLSNNTNNSNNGFDSLGCGGAICDYGYEYGGQSLVLQGNKFTKNSSVGNAGSGAVSVYSYYYYTMNVSLKKNTFSKNETGAGGWGGAVGLYSDDDYSPITARLSSNHFTDNKAGTQSDAGYGGAMSVYYYVSVRDTGSTFSNNQARGDGAAGGAVYDEGYSSSSWTRTKFVGNSAGTNNSQNYGYGGAFYSENYYGDAFTQVTMSGNKSAYAGGGYYGDSSAYQANFKASTISGNSAGSAGYAGQGGGISASDSVLTVQNSTLTGNKATSISGSPGQGGAIYVGGARFGLRFSTVSGNYAKQGAGVYSDIYGSVVGSILSGNKASKHGSEKDCAVAAPAYTLTSAGGNVLGQQGCVQAVQSSDKVSHKLHLGKLKDNGGPTKTMAISQKSPAVGRASVMVPGSDQRGHKRPSKHADAGAYELS
jgi:hypothetical protein